MTFFSPDLDAPTFLHWPLRWPLLYGLLLGGLVATVSIPASGQSAEDSSTVESSGDAPLVRSSETDAQSSVSVSSYTELVEGFVQPDHAQWGEVPLWWWEGSPLTEERVTWQLETLAKEGVMSVCPIQRSPARSDPSSFSPEWWDMFSYVHDEIERLDMTIWAYDQVGYGHYGWLEEAAARVEDTETKQMQVLTAEGEAGQPIRLALPEGAMVLGARAYPLVSDSLARDEGSRDVGDAIQDGQLEWIPDEGRWRVAVSVVRPFQSFYLNPAATDTFLTMLYGRMERTLGEEAMGTTFAGMFQDEHPPTPRDIYTDELAASFRKQHGYELVRAIPALHFDVGPLTPMYRTDFFDTYISAVEDTYWKEVYEWAEERGVLTSYDNWGRQNIYQQTEGYMDYFRTQRWFSAPGYDDSRQAPLTERNYYDTKIAASIARLYDRPRVWSEAFHTSGWGRTTNQTLSWLSTNYAFGANLYDEHGLYYAVNASTWEHAAPDPHWRQPYWRYYDQISDWVARLSYVMSQGDNVADAAVHYPVVSLLAGHAPGEDGPDYNQYMRLSRLIYDEGIDNDIIDDGSILRGTIEGGQLHVGGNSYQALVFGPVVTMRRSVLKKALALAEAGGTVLFFGRVPEATTEGGRSGEQLPSLLEELFGESVTAGAHVSQTVSKRFARGGFAAFVPHTPEQLPALVTSHVNRDFVARGGDVFVSHRRIGDTDAYLVQNAEDHPIDIQARFRAQGTPEQWDLFSGSVYPIDQFEQQNGYTRMPLHIEGNVARLIVFRPDGVQQPAETVASTEQTMPVWQQAQIEHSGDVPLSENWTFSVIPTRDNQWEEFRWPASNEKIGPEVRQVRYREANGSSGLERGWHLPGFDDTAWETHLYSKGPYWLALNELPRNADLSTILDDLESIEAGQEENVSGATRAWEEVSFSQTIGTGEPVPWGGHSGYPDGHMDRNFIDLPDGRKLLFTRLRVEENQRFGLRVELRNSEPRLWVNGKEQPFEGPVGNLPLRGGDNTVLLEVPDGGRGMLYVQDTPPSVRTMAEAAEGGIAPDFREAAWIWAGNADGTHLRRTFTLEEVPEQAQLVVTAYTGYRLFVNGEKIEEEIGPWANPNQPETINIQPYLRQGQNVIAAWGQFYRGQHFNTDASEKERGFALALSARLSDGEVMSLVTDSTWKGSPEVVEGWTQTGFDEAAWPSARVKAQVGNGPLGIDFLSNIGKATTPDRPLSINLSSPYLQVFENGPDVTYDVKPEGATRIGWYRFEVPPGIKRLSLNTEADVEAWVNGVQASVEGSEVQVSTPPAGVATVALRLEMNPGRYGGAAFSQPIEMTLEGGKIQTGEWADYALPTYSGIGVYKQTVHFNDEQVQQHPVLDLGDVRVAAEVLVNGEPAGVRVAAPFKFDLSKLVRPGENVIEVRVANTLASHYSVPDMSLHPGPTRSGLLGPVSLRLHPE